MKTYSFWQSPSYINYPPPYVLLGLASSKFVLGEDFELLTSRSAIDIIGTDFVMKDWKFSNEMDQSKKELMSIVAKSDFIRMSVINKIGGIWIDADTVVLRNYTKFFRSLDLSGSQIAWHCEAFFGALPHNRIMQQASVNMLESEFQRWGNPGGLKDLIRAMPETIRKIPYSFITPGYSPEYNYATRDIMLQPEISADEFFRNSGQHILKLYNTPFANSEFGKMSVAEFLGQDILLAKIFLHINPNKKEWINMTRVVLSEIQ